MTVGTVAHGGFCIARHQGRVVFVRHSLPGEVVVARVTEHGPKGRYLRADTVEVVDPAPGRVAPPCRHAAACGGCDWQHATVATQRELKAAVVAEQLRRLAGVEWSGAVQPVPGDSEGLGWRTRIRLAVDDRGNVGFRRHRSHEVVAVDRCPVAHPLVQSVQTSGVADRSWPPGVEVEVSCAPATGETAVRMTEPPTGSGAPGPSADVSVVHDQAAGRDWRISGGFWQAHPGAPEALVACVTRQLSPRPGEHLVDLYAGVGLFGGALGGRLGEGGRVDLVEADAAACLDAAVNLADLPWATVHRSPVLRHLRHSGLRRADLVVLDPPRTGAGREVTRRLCALRPRAVSYVACDPAALARDVATFAEQGYRLADLQAFDLFPMTHHVECVALLVPDRG
ncbi:MAG: class I SAM-dependent RNA methyltransferase [Actinomycetota bacterium]|nr:class I SAM-dependent RNA methyltransferase [Actinomycetota bacterium]